MSKIRRLNNSPHKCSASAPGKMRHGRIGPAMHQKRQETWFWIGLGAQQKLSEDVFSACHRAAPSFQLDPRSCGQKDPTTGQRTEPILPARPQEADGRSQPFRWAVQRGQRHSEHLAQKTILSKTHYAHTIVQLGALQPSFSPSCSTRSTCELQDCALESESSSEGSCRPYRLGLWMPTGEAGDGFHKSGRRHGTCEISL